MAMSVHQERRAPRRRMVLAALLVALPALAADHKSAHPGPPDLAPALRIPVAPLGYLPPSQNYLTYRIPSSTLNFVDDKHLLFTFHKGSLLRRMPDEPEDDHDQIIHAVVLDLAPEKGQTPGHVTNEADWRMHDHSRYLWQLTNGRFMVRSRNTLYEIDRGLHFTPYARTDTPMTQVEVSADRKLVSIQSEIKGERVESTDSRMLGERPAHKIRMSIISTADDKVKFSTTNPVTVHLPILHEGYVGAEPGDRNTWALWFYPFEGEKRKFAEVLSSCHPQQTPLSSDVVLVSSCTRDSDDQLEQVFSLDGRTLWQQRWGSRYVWPTIEVAENGSRFAYASIELAHPIGTLDPVDGTMMVRQLVGVYDTATGTLRLVRVATPMLTAGGNYALSPDGSRVAVLSDGVIEVYDLPPAPID